MDPVGLPMRATASDAWTPDTGHDMTPSSTRLVVACPGVHAEQYLELLIDYAQRDDRLQPVTVAVPSNFAGLALRRGLAARPGGLVNVRFMVLARVAELLGASRLSHEGKRPLTPWLRLAAISTALREHEGVFAKVAGHPATVQSLDATFRDLRHAYEGALPELEIRGERPFTVVALYRRFRELTGSCYDAEDLAEAAAAAVAAGDPALQDVGHVILYLPRSLTPAQTGLFEALARRGAAQAVFVRTGDPSVDSALADLLTRLGDEAASQSVRANDPPVLDPPPPAITVAIDLEEEARLVVRQVAKAAREGTALYRVGVLYSVPEYGVLLREQFRAAGILCNGAPERSLAQSVAGRTLLGLFTLAGHAPDELGREALMRWLSQAPILERGPGSGPRLPVPIGNWESIAREASIVRGLAQWQPRLRAWMTPRHEAPPSEWRIALGQRLLDFVEELERTLRPPLRPTAATLAARAGHLLDRYLGPETLVREWETPARMNRATPGAQLKDSELEAYKAIRRLLAEIQQPDTGTAGDPFAGMAPGAAWRAFGEALTTLLERPGASAGRFGDGVFVGSIEAARGLSFDRLFIVGMSEGALPPAPREDPLMTDQDREDTQLPSRASRRDELRADYVLARAAAPRCVLSYPRSAIRQQGKLLPSRWLLAEASMLARPDDTSAPGAPGRKSLSAEDLELLPPSRCDWLLAPPSFEAALLDPRLDPAASQEYLLRSLAVSGLPATKHYLAAAEGFGAGIESATVRLLPWQRRDQIAPHLGAFQGGVGADDRLVPWLAGAANQAISPTSLENYAVCPYRYLLKHVLRVEETENPADRLMLEAKERGNIVHEVLEEFLRDSPPAADYRWTIADRQRVRELAEAGCRDRSESGLSGAAIAWESERQSIFRDLDLFLTAEESVRATSGASFYQAEGAFGMPPRDGAAPWAAPVVELSDGRSVRFRGRVDRVDRSPDGVTVYDYKTGKSDKFAPIAKDDPVVRGTKLQLAIYAIAVREALGLAPGVAVRAYYWFVRESERFQQIGYEFNEAREARFHAVLETIVTNIAAGLFPQAPGKTGNRKPENCSYCPYDRICPAGDRGRGWEERKLIPELAGLRGLMEPDAAAGPSSALEAGDD
jgi:ATP-dependent helicase/nuclease subunit B